MLITNRDPSAAAPSSVRALSLLLLIGAASCHAAGDARTPRADAKAATSTAEESTARAADSSPMKHGTVRFATANGDWLVDAELAHSPEEHARGLMFRRELAPDHGMLFVFDETREQRFWMHNTLLRLDMIFLGEDRSVVGVVANAEPQTDTGREVGRPARYVLEVSGGEAATHGVGPGVRAQFVGVDE